METHTYTFVPLLLCSCNPMQWQMLQPARLVFTHEAFVVARSPVELQLHMIFRQPFNPFTPKKQTNSKTEIPKYLVLLWSDYFASFTAVSFHLFYHHFQFPHPFPSPPYCPGFPANIYYGFHWNAITLAWCVFSQSSVVY